MSQLRAHYYRWRPTNTSIRNLLVALLIAFLSGTFSSAVVHFILMQHEPRELFYVGDMLHLSYAPLWATLTAVQFGPLILSAVHQKFRRFRVYALATVVGPFLMGFPATDPLYYSPYYTRCKRASEQEILDVARAGLKRDVDFLVRHFDDTAAEIEAAEMVQFVQWTPLIASAYSVTYRTARGSLFQESVSPACGVELSFPDRIAPVEGRLIFQK